MNQTIYKINSKQTCAQKLKKTDNTLKKEITQLKNVTNSKTSIKNTYKNLLGNGVELQTILDLKINISYLIDIDAEVSAISKSNISTLKKTN